MSISRDDARLLLLLEKIRPAELAQTLETDAVASAADMLSCSWEQATTVVTSLRERGLIKIATTDLVAPRVAGEEIPRMLVKWVSYNRRRTKQRL